MIYSVFVHDTFGNFPNKIWEFSATVLWKIYNVPSHISNCWNFEFTLSKGYIQHAHFVFLHAKPWIPGGENSIFTVVTDEIYLTGPLGTNFSEILIEIDTFSFKKMHLKMSSGRWRPFCLGLNVLTVPLVYHGKMHAVISGCAKKRHTVKCLTYSRTPVSTYAPKMI